MAFVAILGTLEESRRGAGRRAVYFVGTDTTEPRRITDWGEIPGAQWSPKGEWIAFSEPNPDLPDVFVVYPDGSGLKAVTSSADGLGSSGPVWSPDGTRLLFVRNTGGGQFDAELWIAEVDGSGLSQITDRPAEYFSYGWSPAVRGIGEEGGLS